MLLDKLIAKQRQGGYTDKEFAEKLGIPRSTWQLTRTRKVPLGPRVARGAQQTFPDLASDVALFLLFGANERAADANAVTSKHELTAS